MARPGERVTCEAIDEHFTPTLLGQIVQTKLGDGVVRFVGFLQHTAEPRCDKFTKNTACIMSIFSCPHLFNLGDDDDDDHDDDGDDDHDENGW